MYKKMIEKNNLKDPNIFKESTIKNISILTLLQNYENKNLIS